MKEFTVTQRDITVLYKSPVWVTLSQRSSVSLKWSVPGHYRLLSWQNNKRVATSTSLITISWTRTGNMLNNDEEHIENVAACVLYLYLYLYLYLTDILLRLFDKNVLKTSDVNFNIYLSTFFLKCIIKTSLPPHLWRTEHHLSCCRHFLQVQPASGARTGLARPRPPLGPSHSPGLFKCSPPSLQWALLLSSLCAPERRILASDRRTERTVCVTHLSVWTSCRLETCGEFVLLLCAERRADTVDTKCV